MSSRENRFFEAMHHLAWGTGETIIRIYDCKYLLKPVFIRI
jgi:hypothetical protein